MNKSMKQFAPIIFLMTLSAQLLSQKVVLYAPKTTAKWPMLDNRFRFYIPNTSCDSIIFKCDNGKIVKNIEHPCWIYFTPDSLANTTFKVYKKNKGKLILIDTIPIRVDESMESYAYLGTKTGGTLSKDLIIACGGLVVHTFVSEGHAEGSKLVSYRIITIRGDSIETAINIGNRYSDRSIELLRKLKSGDSLLFTDIIIDAYPHRVFPLKPMEIKVE